MDREKSLAALTDGVGTKWTSAISCRSCVVRTGDVRLCLTRIELSGHLFWLFILLVSWSVKDCSFFNLYPKYPHL